MGFSLFLSLDGVVGESTAIGHEGQIELSEWAFGLHNAGSGVGGGRVGKPVWDEVSVAMPTTAALPQLMSLCASGRATKTAVLSAVSEGDHPFTWLRLTLSNVLVTRVGSAASALDDRSDDEAGLSFGAITVEKWSQLPDGSVGAPVTFRWDVRVGRSLKGEIGVKAVKPSKPAKPVKPVKAAKAAKARKGANGARDGADATAAPTEAEWADAELSAPQA